MRLLRSLFRVIGFFIQRKSASSFLKRNTAFYSIGSIAGMAMLLFALLVVTPTKENSKSTSSLKLPNSLNKSNNVADVAADMFGESYTMFSTDETLDAGALIVNMSVEPQTIANGLKPYGMIFDLIKNHGITVKWVIDQTKTSDKNTGVDGVDFSYNGTDYKSGAFIIPAAFRSVDVNATINSWILKGVITETTTTDITVPVFIDINNVPNWTLDEANGGKVLHGFDAAEIPEMDPISGKLNFYFKEPHLLDCCDYLYIMPHADPEWETHSRLYEWTLNKSNGPTSCRGWVWSACHAVSALENSFDYITPDVTKQLNFLIDKSGNADPNNDPWAENSAVLWGDHGKGDGAYDYDNSFVGDPFMQFMGKLDGAQENGSEQLYMPYANTDWRASSSVAIYDGNGEDVQPGEIAEGKRAAKLAYGPAFGVGDKSDYTSGNGWVMYEAGHSISGDEPQFVAAFRAFFNFSFMAAVDRGAEVDYVQGPPDTILAGEIITLKAKASQSQANYTFDWSFSTGEGTFSGNPAMAGEGVEATVTYMAPATDAIINGVITLSVRDACTLVNETKINSNVVIKPPPPVQPICIDSTFSSPPNAELSVDLSTLIIDANTPSSGFSIVTQPTNGTVSLSALAVATYLPDFNSSVQDSFEYQACDLDGLCCTGTVVINIECPTDGSTSKIFGTAFYDGNKDGMINGDDYGYPGGAKVRLYQDNAPVGTLDGSDVELVDFSPDTTNSIGGYSFSLLPTPPQTDTLEILIAAEADDAFQKRSALIDGSTTFKMGGTDEPYVGMRFQNVTIPQGTAITSAHIQFTSSEKDKTITGVKIGVHDSDNSPDFVYSPGGYLSAIYNNSTITPATGNMATTSTKEEPYNSMPLTSLVSSIIGKTGWNSGNAITFIIDNTGGTSAAGTYFQDETTMSYRPVLMIDTGSGLVSYPMISATDDAHHAKDKNDVSSGNSDFQLQPDDNFGFEGFLFKNVNIPEGVTINSAALTFTSTNNKGGTINDIKIGVQDIANAPAIGTDPFYLSDLYHNSTITPATGSINAPTASAVSYQTFSIQSLLSSITSKPGWVDGNDILFIMNIDESDDTNGAKFHDFNAVSDTLNPTLRIIYTKPEVFPNGDFIVAIDTSLFGVGENPTPLVSPTIIHSMNLTGTGDSDCFNDFGITIPNIPPKANNVTNPSLMSCAGTSVVLPLNGQDPDGTVDMYKVVSMPSTGSLLHNMTTVVLNTVFSSTDTLKYNPDLSITGEITFRYVAIDNEGSESDTATYTLVISNCPPETIDGTNDSIFSTSSEAALTDLLSGTDGDGDVVSIEIVTIPASNEGILLFNGVPVSPGQIIDTADVDLLTFAPSGSFLGNSTFTFAAIDDAAAQDGSPATYTIPILNSLPFAVDVTNPVHLLDTGEVKLVTPLLGTDVDGSVVKYVVKTLPSATGGVILLGGSPISAGDTLTTSEATMINFDPTSGFSGDVSFTYESIDDQGGVSTTSGTYTIKITTAPVANDVINDIILVVDDFEPLDSLNTSDDQGIEDYFFCEIPNDSLGTIYFLRNGTDTMFLIANDPMTNAEMKTMWFEPAGFFPMDININYAVQDSCGFIAKADYIIPFKKFEISLAKSVEGIPIKDPSTGYYNVKYKYIIKNEGSEDLDSLSLTDNFATQFGSAFQGTSTMPATITLEGPAGTGAKSLSFTGAGSTTELLDRNGKLAPGDTLAVTVEVLIDPDVEEDPLKNQANTMGVPVDDLGLKFNDENGNNYGFVSDESDSGTNPSSSNDTALGAQPDSLNDSTWLYIPDISVTKSIGESKLLNNGNVQVTFNFEIQNTGNTWLTNLSLEDSLYFNALSAMISLVNNDATAVPSKNGSYNGNGNNDLLSGSSTDTLKSGESFAIELIAEVAPTDLAAISPTNNRAKASGDVFTENGAIPGYTTVSDLSDDVTDLSGGGDPATSNSGALGDTGGYDDPSPLTIPIIAATKEVSLVEPASSGNGGNADVTFLIKIKNLGADTLENISLIDSMFSQMGGVGGGFVGVVTTPSVISGMSSTVSNPSPNGAFGPDAQANLLLGTDGTMAPGDSITISVEVELDPNGATSPMPLTNQATSIASSTLSGESVSDLSDSGSDPATTNPGAAGDSGTHQDPTPITISKIGLAKQLLNTDVVGDNYAVTFRLSLKNIGNDTLSNVVLKDNLLEEFGAAFVDFDSTTVSINTSGVTGTAPMYNMVYDGGQVVSDSIYTASSGGALAPNDLIAIDLTVIINPNAVGIMLPQDLTNQAIVSAKDSNGNQISDLSDSGADPDGNNNGESGDSGSGNDPTPLPAIGVAKETGDIIGPDIAGLYEVNFNFNVKNTGTDTLVLTGLTDDIKSQLGDAFIELDTVFPPTTNSAVTPVIVVNPLYDGGVTNDSLFAFSQMIKLAPLDTIGFSMTIKIDPSLADTALSNQAVALGVGQSGFLISDASDSGMSPNGSNEGGLGDTGGSGDPSPILIPQIGLTKTITQIDEPPASGTTDNFDVTFQFSLENTGTVNLSNPNLVDNLKSQLGDAFVGVVGVPSISYSDVKQVPTINSSYTGIAPNDSIFNSSSMGFFEPSDSIVFELKVEINPNGGTQPLDNQAIGSAAAVDAANNPIKDDMGMEIVVSDLSDSGSDTRGANSADPDDLGTKDDPTRILLPSISSTKSILSTIFNPVNRHYDLTFEILSVNTGSDTLQNLIIKDDVATQFGATFIAADASDISIVKEVVQVNGNKNTSFNGGSDDTLYIAAVLAPNDSVIIHFIVEIDADAVGGPNPLLNSAIVQGIGSQSGESASDSTDAATPMNPDVEGPNTSGPGDTGGVNDPLNINIPVVAFNDTTSTNANMSIGIMVFDNDAEGLTGFNPTSVDTIAGTGPANGSLLVNMMTGEITYIPEYNYAGPDQFDYVVCDSISPSNCDTATVFVTITSLPIIANDDVDTTKANTLVNIDVGANDNIGLVGFNLSTLDTVGGQGPLNGSVEIKMDGTFDYTPGTNYTGIDSFVYMVCDSIHPIPNCDTATVVVHIPITPLEAVDDDFTSMPFNGLNGGHTPYILANDSLEHAVLDSADITLSPVYGMNTDTSQVYLDPTDGTVIIKTGTKAGDYDVVYSICENLNPINCDTATVTVTVVPAPIEALDDDYTSIEINGYTGDTTAYILANDSLNNKVLDSVMITLKMLSTDTSIVYLDPAIGAVIVNEQTPAGIYKVEYEICENLNPANCDTAVVTINVVPAPIEALDDDYTSIDINGYIGDTTAYILSNDSLNTIVVDSSEVTMTMISTDTSIVHLDPSIGAVIVDPQTPAGEYEVEYSICEKLNSANCDTAIVTVTVVAAPIVAIDNNFSDMPIGGFLGGMTPVILPNDSLNSQVVKANEVTISPIESGSTNTAQVHVDSINGVVVVKPGTTGGTYFVAYEICENLNPENCDTALVEVLVAEPIIALTKSIVDISYPASTGNPDHNNVTFQLVVKALGNDTLENVQIVDSLLNQFGPAFVEIIGDSTEIISHQWQESGTVNTGYDGSTDQTLFDVQPILAPGDSVVLHITAVIDPNASMAPVPLTTNAIASGTGVLSHFMVDDMSDAGLLGHEDPDGTNPGAPGDTGGMDDPLEILIPQISTTMSIEELRVVSQSGVADHADVVLEVVVMNTGNDTLSNVQFVNDMMSAFGDAFVGVILDSTSIVSQQSQIAPVINGNYDGNSNDSLYSVLPTLAPGDSVVMRYIVEVEPGANGLQGPLENQGTANGTGLESGTEVSDDTDAATQLNADPESTNPDGPGDTGGVDDPLDISVPIIGSTKSIVNVTHPSSSGTYGHVDIQFEIMIESLGNDTLEQVQISDNLLTQLGNAFVRVVPGTITIPLNNGETPAVPNVNFDGHSESTLFSTQPSLTNGDLVLVRFIVEVDPNAPKAPVPLTNSAKVTGEGSLSEITITDLTDATTIAKTDPDGTNPSGPGDTGGIDDPLEIIIPQISTTMSIEELRVVSQSGVADHADVVLEVVVMNTGNDTLSNVQFVNDMMSAFGDAFVGVIPDSTSIVSQQSQIAPVINGNYDGNSNDSLYSVLPTLAPGDSVVMRYIVEVEPGANGLVVPLENQGTANGTGLESGTEVSDDTDAATQLNADPESTNPDGPGDTGGADDSLEISVPIIGTTLSLVDVMHPPASGDYDHVDATFEIVVVSQGNDPLSDVQLIETLQDQFGSAFIDVVPGTITIVSQQSQDPAVANESFNGEINDSLFSTLPTLANGDSVVIQFVVEIDPNADGAPVPLTNQVDASGTGTASGLPVTDLSDAATMATQDPMGTNPEGPGDTGGIDDPLEILIPQISTTMSIEELRVVSQSGVADHADVVLEVVVMNTGNDTLSNVQFVNDMMSAFGDAFIGVIPDSTSIVSQQSQIAPVINGNYDGNSNDSLYSVLPTLAPGDSVVIRYFVEVEPGATGLMEPLMNHGTANGTGIGSGIDVSDDTDAATQLNADPESTNPDGPGDTGGADDPLEISVPMIGMTKSLVDNLTVHPASSGNYGNVDITFEINVTSIGNDTLTSVQVTDDLASQFGNSFERVVPNSVSIILANTQTPVVSNTDFNGNTDTELFSVLPNMSNGDYILFRFKVEINPNASGAPVPLLNSAEAQGVGLRSHLRVNDLSDAATTAKADPMGTNPEGPGDTGGIDDPLEIIIPQISTTMSIEELRVVSQSGVADHADVVLEVVVMNTGNDTLSNVQFVNDMMSAFGDAFIGVIPDSTSIVSQQSQIAPVINGNYDGNSNDSLYSVLPTLAPGDSVVMRYIVEVEPGANGLMVPIENQGTANGTGLESGTEVSDNTDAATQLNADPESTNPDGPGDTGGADDPLEISVPIIGTTLSLVDVMHPPASGDYDHVDATFEIVVFSQGNDPLSDVQLIETLQDQFGSAFIDVVPGTITIVSQQSQDPAVANESFDGEMNDSLFSTLPTLANGDSVVIQFVVEIDPNADGAPVPLTNQVDASGTGTASGLPVTDLSDAATMATQDPMGTNPEGPGDTGGIDDPLEILIPQISTTMSIEELRVVSQSGVADHADVVLEVVVMNTGNDTLSNVQFVNDMMSAFGDAFVGVILDSTSIVSHQSQIAPVINGNYDGNSNDSLYSVLPTLAPGDSVVMRYIVEVEPGVNGLNVPLENQGTATGTGVESGTDVSDDTDAATQLNTDPESTNPDGPGDTGGADDPLEISVPIIGTTLSLVDVMHPPASGDYDHVDATFEIVVVSQGNDPLSDVQLIETLQDQFGSAFIDVVPGTITIVSQQSQDPAVANESFDGEMNDSLFSTLPTLANGDSVVIRFVVEIDPNADGAPVPLTNQVDASGTGTASGLPVTDLSDAATMATQDPMSTNPDGPGDTGGIDDPLEIHIPILDLTKYMTNIDVPAASGMEGSIDVTYQFIVENIGNDTMEQVQIYDDLAGQIGEAFIKVTGDPIIIEQVSLVPVVINSDYDGISNFAMFSTEAILKPGGYVIVEIPVELNPLITESSLQFNNQALTIGSGVNSTTSLNDLQENINVYNANSDDVIVGPEIIAADLSDSGINPETTNPDSPDDEGTGDDPTIGRVPMIGLAKQIIDFDEAVSGTVGNWDVTYQFKIQNTGNVDLTNIQIRDDLKSQLYDAFVRVVDPSEIEGVEQNPYFESSGATIDPLLNLKYEGEAPLDNLFEDNTGILKIDSMIVVNLVIEVDPNANTPVDTLFNSAVATANGNNDDAFPAFDISDNGDDPTGTNPIDCRGCPFETKMDPTPLLLLDINVAKQIVGVTAPSSGTAGNANVEFELKIKNKGNENMLSINLYDDLRAQLGDAFFNVASSDSLGYDNPRITASSALIDPTINEDFTGESSNSNLFNDDGELRPNDTIVVNLIVEVDPNLVDDDGDGMPDILFNQAEVAGTNIGGYTITDLSDSGSDPESPNENEPNDSGGMDDPTPIEVPVLSVAKSINRYQAPASGTGGNLDLVFHIVLENTGNVRLDELQIVDEMDLPENIGPAYVGLSQGAGPTIISGDQEEDPQFNPLFDGFSSGDPNLFDGASGSLLPGQHLIVELIVEISPALADDPENLFNQAEGTGVGISEFPTTGSNGLPNDRPIGTVSDDSDSGMDPETNNGQGDSNTPTYIIPCFSDGKISCVSEINLSLDENCMAIVLPHMLSNNVEPYCDDYYHLTLKDDDGNILEGNKIDQTFIGKTVQYILMEPEDSVTCWGTINVEYKLNPSIICNIDTVSCAQNIAMAIPEIQTVCGDYTFIRSEIIREDLCKTSPDFIAKETVIYAIQDEFGNISDTCAQVRYILKPNLDSVDIDWPTRETILSCDADIFDENGEVLPRFGGVPMWDGLDLTDPNLPGSCNVFTEYEDLIELERNCEKRIIREWTVSEWLCEGGVTELTFIQTIVLRDTTAPQIELPTPIIELSTNGHECVASFVAPRAAISDNCQPSETIEVEVRYPGGTILGNGGDLITLGLGENQLIEYVARDRCGNESRDSMYVDVMDLTPPVPVCLREIVINLDDTKVRLRADQIDHDSYDDCGIDRITIRRMNEGCNPRDIYEGEYVTFCCEDANQDIPVILRIYDLAGNFNECMIMVGIQDKSPAQVECLPDLTISCDFDFDPDGLLTPIFGTVLTGSGSVPIVPLGIPKEFVVDSSGRLINGRALDNCGVSVRELPPIINRDEVCRTGTIRRTIIVTGASGIETRCVQNITIVGDQENNPLEFEYFPPDIELIAENPDDVRQLAIADPPVVRNVGCSLIGIGYRDQVFRVEGEFYCTKIVRTWEVIDWCRNPNGEVELSGIQKILVVDNDAPEILVENPLIIPEPIQGDAVELVATATDNVIENPKFLSWRYEVFFENDSQPIAADTIALSDFAGNNAVISLDDIVTGNYTVNWYAVDKCLNEGMVAQELIVEDRRSGEEVSISGQVFYSRGGVMDNIEVHLSEEIERYDEGIQSVTDIEGAYAFDHMPLGGQYYIDPEKNDDPLNGVSTLDLILIQRHILGLSRLEDPALQIAADVNKDGSVSSRDLVEMRRLLLGYTSEFENKDSWVFVYDKQDLEETMLNKKPLQETYYIPELVDNMNISFVGIKTGDVSGDAIAHSAKTGDGRSLKQISWHYEFSQFNGNVALSISADRLRTIEGLQGSWEWPQGLDFVGVIPGVLDISEEDYRADHKRHILNVVYHSESQDINPEAELFTVVFSAYPELEDLEFRPAEKGLPLEVYENNGAVQLILEKKDRNNIPIVQLNQNKPNPWSEATTIDVETSTDGKVFLRVFDIHNRIIHKDNGYSNKGLIQFKLIRDDFPESGLYFYEIEMNGIVKREKMIKVN